MNSPLHNPFATRYTRPGAVPFFFSAGECLEEGLKVLLIRLQENHGWGEIIGPHGSGKSTLLAHLLPVLENAGERPLHFTLRDGQRRLPSGWTRLAHEATLLVIDGYEQLSRLARWRLKRFCRRHGCGLLVTAHASAGLPPLYRTQGELKLARQVVHHLLSNRPLPSDRELSQLFAAHQGDVREMLFALYDRYGPSQGDAR